jgi:tetratricopeptide (TPR) repeat protein
VKSRVTSPDGPAKQRLESWKEVADYFGRTDRTVKRWEAERGLPIRRPPGAGRGRIYAEVAELEGWLKGGVGAEGQDVSTAEPAAEAEAAARDRARPARLWLMAIAAVTIPLVALIAAASIWARLAPPPLDAGASDPPLAAQRQYVAGIDDWQKRTPESLNRSIDEFRAAIALYPRYAQAYAGLADCYDLLRQYTLMPATQSYALARAAAEKALALDERVAGAHAALGFADYFGYWDAAGARAHFQRAIALDPHNETARHWFATFLLSAGDHAGALKQIDAALALDPASLSIRADRDVIREGVAPAASIADLERLAREHPKFLSPHVYLADHAQRIGDDRTFLEEASAAAELTSDWARLAILAAARRGLRTGGHRGMLEAMFDAQARRFEAGEGDALDLARIAALLGDRKTALAYLGLAADRRETDFSEKAIDSTFDFVAGDPAYQRLVARLRPGG